MGKKRTKKNRKDVVVRSNDLSFLDKVRMAWQKFNSNLLNQLLLKFIALISLFYLIWASPWFQKTVVIGVAKVYAKVASILLNIMGYGVAANNDILGTSAFSMSIQNGCDGIEGLAIYLCAIVIYPATKNQKLKGLLYGLSFLVLLNLARLVNLYMIGIHLPSLFDLMHESLWQILFIALTLVALFVWVDAVNKTKKKLGSDEITQ